MTSWNLCLLSALLYYSVAAGEPSCENVEDFGRCDGDAGDFCPQDIACSCKSGQPFCSCPYYTGPNGNYWYLGEKCNQLWSTMDMIVICVLPAVALGFIVAVTAQLIHYCKTKPTSRTVKEPKKKSEQKTTNTHHNAAFIPDVAPSHYYSDLSPGNGREQVQPKIQAAQWNAAAAEAPNPRRLKYYSEVPPVSQSSSYYEGRPQSVYNGYSLPEQENQGYELRGQEPEYARVSRAPLPSADYQRAPEPSGPSDNSNNRPFRFGRPQVKSSNDY